MTTSNRRTARSSGEPAGRRAGLAGAKDNAPAYSEALRDGTPSKKSPESYTPRTYDRNEDEYIIEDITGRDAAYDGDVEVLVPYEYEEVESEPSTTPILGKRKARHDADQVSRSGLVESLRALDCDSDRADHDCPPLQIREQKRKKSGDWFSGQVTPYLSPDPGYLEVVDLEDNEQQLSPNKGRKRRRTTPRNTRAPPSSMPGRSRVEHASSAAIHSQDKSGGLGKTTTEHGDMMDVS
ncbi:hypothetical protein FQN50_007068 [Emmonsiellopsis sp. PD_5]|nr:hypothetical protein FQN50_007068 [Emmonsiellopsis sp. PD_5]